MEVNEVGDISVKHVGIKALHTDQDVCAEDCLRGSHGSSSWRSCRVREAEVVLLMHGLEGETPDSGFFHVQGSIDQGGGVFPVPGSG